MDNSLKIYKNTDGSYEAIRGSKLYSFLWNDAKYIVYNFKKLGTIGTDYKIKGKLVKDPHIQMIMQVQNKIGEKMVKESLLNENIEDLLKPKNKEEIDEYVKNYKPIYKEWLKDFKKIRKLKPEEISIWKDFTSGGTEIIKIKAPNVRETTIIRFEKYSVLSNDIVKYLNSKKIKNKISKNIYKDLIHDHNLLLISMIKNESYKYGGVDWSVAEEIANYLKTN